MHSIEVAGLFTCEECAEWKWPTYAFRQAPCGFFLRNWVNLRSFRSSLISCFWLQESNLLPVLLCRLTNIYLCLMQLARIQGKQFSGLFFFFFLTKKGSICNPMCIFSISWIMRPRDRMLSWIFLHNWSKRFPYWGRAYEIEFFHW